MSPRENSGPIEGLERVLLQRFDRVPIRLRESSATLSGWQMTITSANGPGTIDCVDTHDSVAIYRGQGVFLGWSQARLRAAYSQLLPQNPPPEPDAGQFG